MFSRQNKQLEELRDKLDQVNQKVENLEKQLKEGRQRFKIYGSLVTFVAFLTGLGLLNLHDITNHIVKHLYTPDFIYDELVKDQDLTLDVDQITSKDANVHDDILNIITQKWELEHYRNFVEPSDLDKKGASHLYTALRLHHQSGLNRILTEETELLADPNFFTNRFGGTNFKVKIELLWEYGRPDKCGGSNIKKTDRKIIFVRSKAQKDSEKALDCPGTTRPRIYVALVGPELGSSFEVVGINKSKTSELPIVRVTERVAKELGWTEEPLKPFSTEGYLTIERGAPLWKITCYLVI